MLGAPGLVEAERLEMGSRVGGDANVAIGRRDGEGADAGERRLVGDALALRIVVDEALAGAPAADGQVADLGAFQMDAAQRGRGDGGLCHGATTRQPGRCSGRA